MWAQNAILPDGCCQTNFSAGGYCQPLLCLAYCKFQSQTAWKVRLWLKYVMREHENL